MFGQPATATTTPGSLFGQPTVAATTTATSGGGLFGQPATSTAKTGSLFGQPAAATTTTTSGGGLFGQPATTTATSGSLFGQPAAAKTTATTGSLFGQPTAAATTTTSGGGLFGQPATNTATTGSLFGQPAATTTTTTSGGGLFGQLATTGNGSVFGQTNQSQNIFGNIEGQGKQLQSQQVDTNAGLFGKNLTGGLSLGQNSTQQQQTIPGVLIDTSNIRGTTRFNDLKEELQKQLIEIDTMIQAQIQLKNDCDAIMPAHESQLTQIPIDVEFCQRKLVGVDNAADSDIHAISAVQKLIKNDAEAAKLSFAAIDILKLPPQYHLPGVWSPKNNNRDGNGETEGIVGFFSQTADELSAKLATYQRHISEIEQHLRGVEANSAHQINTLAAKKNGNAPADESSFDQLAGVLRDFETGLLNIAGKVGETRKGVTALQLNQFFPTASNYRV